MDNSYKNDSSYWEEYYYEVYLPYMQELYENCSDEDCYDIEEIPKEPTEKEINKLNRKAIIDEAIKDFPCSDVLDEKGKSRLSLNPKLYVKKALKNDRNSRSHPRKSNKRIPFGKGKYYTNPR